MNILIIGGTGFIGTNLANKLISQGYNVSVVGIPIGSEKFDVYNVSLVKT
ncbi:MAG: NAD-dependent epimerase/dehydratase family protein, partial [Mycoplasmatales bacterium]